MPDQFPPQSTTDFGIIVVTAARIPSPGLAYINLQLYAAYDSLFSRLTFPSRPVEIKIAAQISFCKEI